MKKYSKVLGNEEQPAFLGDLEQPDADQPVVPEKSGDHDRGRVRPVAVDRKERNGEVVDVEGFVVVLVAVEVEVGELLEDRLVGSVDDEREQDRR